MYYAYILYSQSVRAHYYGMTDDVLARLSAHNAGQSFHTKKSRPWVLVWYGAFVSREMAADFEKYLKTGSGQAFARKRLSRSPQP